MAQSTHPGPDATLGRPSCFKTPVPLPMPVVVRTRDYDAALYEELADERGSVDAALQRLYLEWETTVDETS